MAHSIETSVMLALGVVACLPNGQVADGIYVNRHFVADGKSRIIELIAIHEGAQRLAQEPSVRCVVLARNPDRRDWGRDAVNLSITSDETVEVVIRPGEIVGIEDNKLGLVEAVICNIALLKRYIGPEDRYPIGFGTDCLQDSFGNKFVREEFDLDSTRIARERKN